MNRPICSPCEVEMRPVKNGVAVVEHASFGPAKVWDADEYGCPKCGHRIITGFGDGPLFHHFEAGFEPYMKGAEQAARLRHNREFVELDWVRRRVREAGHASR